MYKFLTILTMFIFLNANAEIFVSNLISNGDTEALKQAFDNKQIDINTTCTSDNTPMIVCAVQYNQIEVTDFLLSKGADIGYKDHRGQSLLHLAAYDDTNISMFKYLESKGLNLNIKDSDGETPAYNAAFSGNVSIIKYMFTKGVIDINTTNSYDQSLFYMACENSHLEIIKYFISEGIDINKKLDNFLPVAILLAGYKKDNVFKTLKYLHTHGADISDTHLLKEATRAGKFKSLKYLLQENNLQNDIKVIKGLLQVSAKSYRAMTILQYLMGKVTLSKNELDDLLYISVKNDNLKIAKYLISQGADVNAKDKYNDPIVFIALLKEKVFNFLIENGVDHRVFNSDGETILHDIVSSSGSIYSGNLDDYHKKMRELLLKDYFSMDTLDDNANTLLHSACKTNNISMIENFLDYNLSMSKINKDGETPLDIAMKYSDEKTLIFIIEKYTDLFENIMSKKIDKWDEEKRLSRWAEYSSDFFTLISPLISLETKEKLFHLTILKKNYSSSKILVQNGVDINLQDKDKNTILHHLSYTKDVSLLDWFLKNNANRYLVNLHNETPLHIAISENSLEFTKLLLKENIQLSKRYTNGRSVLHEAVTIQNIELLKLITPLIENVNIQDYDGNTALHIAAKNSSIEILKYLVLVKSNPNINNNFNITPSMLIHKRKDLNKKELSSFMYTPSDIVHTVIKPYIFFSHDVKTITVLSDNSKFILGHRDSIYIWDVKSFREVKKLKLKEAPREIKPIPNSSRIALKNSGKISIYDIDSEEYVMTFNIPKLHDFVVSLMGNKIYALSNEDKLFHIDLQSKSMIVDENMVDYISSYATLDVAKGEQLFTLYNNTLKIYDFEKEITSKYTLESDKSYRVNDIHINEELDVLILDQEKEEKHEEKKRDIYVKNDNTYIKLKSMQRIETFKSSNIVFDKKKTILYILDDNKSKLYTYSKKNHFEEESINIPSELIRSNFMIMNDQVIFTDNPHYGSLKVSLFDLKSQRIISSKESSSEDTGYNLFVKHFDYKRSKLNNQKLYQDYYYRYNAYDNPMKPYILVTNKDGSTLTKKKGNAIIKNNADGSVMYTLDTEHKYYLQYRIDEKSTLMATWSETTEPGEVSSDDFLTLLDIKNGSIKKKIQVKDVLDFGFIGKYLYIQLYRNVKVPQNSRQVSRGPISLYDKNTGEYIKSIDIPSVNLKIEAISENPPYISFTNIDNNFAQPSISILDIETEEILIKFETESYSFSSFLKDNILAYLNTMGKVVLYDLNTKKELYVFKDIEETVYKTFTVNDNTIGFSTGSGKFVLYDLHTKKKLVDILTFKDSWIMITPESYFTGGGNFADKLTFLDGFQNIYDTHQLYDHFFRPDIVKLKLYGEDISKFIKGNTLKNALSNPPPKLSFKSIDSEETKTSGFEYNAVETKKEKVKLTFNVNEHDGGGVGLIRVYQEGKLIQTIGEGKINKQSANIDAILEQEKLDSTLKENQRTYFASLSKSVSSDVNMSVAETIATVAPKTTTNQSGTYNLEIELKSGKNEISIEAFNKTNTVTSYRENITINANIPKQKPKLYAIVAGVNKFEANNKKYQLQYSENDAQAIKETAEQKMKTVFDDVEVIYLTGKEVTKDNILKAAQEISKKAKLDDTVLFYISTHGRAANGKLYLVPYNNKIFKNWIDFEQTFQAVQSIKALNQIFIIDACESGKANDIVSSVYDSRASVLAKSSGVHMLLATTKGTYAFEHPDPNITNGVFTHKILQAMQNKQTDANKDSLISILELSKKLKEPSNNADYQYPVIRNVGKDVELERIGP